MSYEHYVEEGTIYGCVASFEYERRNRMVARYWAQVTDHRDAQYPIVCCGHEHREPEAALLCLRRLMRLVTYVARPFPCGPEAIKVELSPDQIRGAVQVVLAARAS